VKEMSKRTGIPGAQLAIMVLANALSAFNIWRMSRQLREAYNINISVRRIPNIFINRSEFNLVYTSKELQPLADQFDDSYRFVGAMISPPRDVDFPFPEYVEGRTLIYISLGTVRTDRLDFFRACLSAFQNIEYLVVMSVGRNIDIKELGPLPSNFLVYNFVPWQLEILKKAKLFITHGGVNSVSEGLFFGVPLLFFPQTLEQNFNARLAEDVGAGKILKESELEADKILQLAKRLIETDTYRKAAQLIGDSLRSAGGPRRAVQEIEDFKRKFVK
jgi:MGT family glycosyltransferase